MPTVVLVGAGASVAEAPVRSSRGQRPPLDSTFFLLCKLARLRGRHSVRHYMQERYGIDPFVGQRSMEEVFNYIYGDAFSPSADESSFDVYADLVRMYQEAIARTTNKLSGTSPRGVGGLLKHLWATKGEREISFVTFNQDLLIERAIDNVAHHGRYDGMPWDVRQCYGIRMSRYLGGGGPFFQATTPGKSISVLKLHGSLNWVYKVRSGEDPRNYIRAVPQRFHCVTDVAVTTHYRFKERSRTMPVIPFVVPPIYEKSTQYQEAIDPIWRRAEKTLMDADRLIIFGYSFPSADFAAKRLLRRAFHSNRQLDEVAVIDPASAVPHRIGDLLPDASVFHHRTVPGYVSRDS